MNIATFIKLITFLVAASMACHATEKPNIIFILADDMGYGDVSCLNPEAKFKTPHLDSMAATGLTFTDAHTSSAVCTPSRYSVLTGRYCWRSRLKRSVIGGYSGALLEGGRETMASALKAQGYNTACIGKWHLGMNFSTTDGKRPQQTGKDDSITTNIDWEAKIGRTPTSNGFDYFFGINGSLDMPPYVYIENEHFIGKGTEIKAFHRPGPAHPDFEAINVMGELTDKVIEYIGKQQKDKPFFIYFPMTAPHNPIVPTKDFQGKSPIGSYGDFCMEVDHHVGEVMEALKTKGIAENTLVVFTSDNGPENLTYNLYRNKKHAANGLLRGVKRDLWEGGHRIPTFVHWPAVIKGGRKSDETICLTDFMPTFAAITGHQLPENAAEDGVSILPIFKEEQHPSPLREGTVHHSLSGEFALRQGDWVFIDAPDGSDRDKEPDWIKTERGYLPHKEPGELFNLSQDFEQKRNVYTEHPERVQKMKALLEHYKSNTRSVERK